MLIHCHHHARASSRGQSLSTDMAAVAGGRSEIVGSEEGRPPHLFFLAEAPEEGNFI